MWDVLHGRPAAATEGRGAGGFDAAKLPSQAHGSITAKVRLYHNTCCASLSHCVLGSPCQPCQEHVCRCNM
jgi:hypothetical protein